MVRGETVTAIIPVRGGSKGIPGKNLRRIGKDTLLERAIKLALASPRVDRTLVSTDDPQMHEIAQGYGVAAPSLRPARLAGDLARTQDVVRHLLGEAAIEDGYLLLLQATAPLRILADLEGLCARFEAHDEAEAIVSLCEYGGPHPRKLQKIENGWVSYYEGKPPAGPRQELPTVYALNGAFYLTPVRLFNEQGTFMPARTIAYLMPPERSANLDTMTDLQILEAMLAQGYWTLEEYD